MINWSRSGIKPSRGITPLYFLFQQLFCAQCLASSIGWWSLTGNIAEIWWCVRIFFSYGGGICQAENPIVIRVLWWRLPGFEGKLLDIPYTLIWFDLYSEFQISITLSGLLFNINKYPQWNFSTLFLLALEKCKKNSTQSEMIRILKRRLKLKKCNYDL